VIYCSHVLEHVHDDMAALREFYRTLKPNGFALFMVPITALTTTAPDPTVATDAERLRLYGQKDHVRRYGPDFADRVRSAGFQVQVIKPRDLVSSEAEVKRYGLLGEVFCCTKGRDVSNSSDTPRPART
jgi:predicted SAM-dependent methyltransferase